MDIKNILPLLLAKKGDNNSQIASVLSSLTQNKKDSDTNSTTADKTMEDLVSAFADNKNPNVKLATSLMQNLNKKKTKPKGLKPIAGFCPDDILGKLTKYYG